MFSYDYDYSLFRTAVMFYNYGSINILIIINI